MRFRRFRVREWPSWAALGAMAVLCAGLGALQYRWMGEISRAEESRLRTGLQGSLERAAAEFDRTIETTVRALVPSEADLARTGNATAAYGERIETAAEARKLVRQVGLVTATVDLPLQMYDPHTRRFVSAQWPVSWLGLQSRLKQRLQTGGRPGPFSPDDSPLVEVPRFRSGLGAGEFEWLVIEFDLDALRRDVMPALLARHLGSETGYEVDIVSRSNPAYVVYRPGAPVEEAAAITPIFDFFPPLFLRRPMPGSPPGPPPSGARPRPRGPMADNARWLLRAAFREGNVNDIVDRARWRNLGISGGILLLMLGAAGALLRFSRRAQEMAALQMNFVTGVSHELRTPLTVIRMAAFNLLERPSGGREHVERYAALIQDQSEKLGAMVEQVLDFANAQAGHLVRRRDPVAVENVIEEGLEAAGASHSGVDIDKKISPGLPLVLGDEAALRQAVRNLVENAVKYGAEGGGWVGVAASQPDPQAVEIRVEDQGPGIPADEMPHVFEPFFRGRHAIAEQIHGTGLGLNLVQRIVEAHGGTIRAETRPEGGAAFVMRLPAAPREFQDEFTHTAD
jgi:signal transduction histidine kinase